MPTITKLTPKITVDIAVELLEKQMLDDKEHRQLFSWKIPFDLELYQVYGCGECELKKATMLEF